jgi:hypothetical protein
MSIGQTYQTATRFSLTIDNDNYRDVVAALVDFNHPSVSRPAAQVTARDQNIPVPGSRFAFEPLVVRVQLASDGSTYRALYDWMMAGTQLDIILTTYDSNSNAGTQIRYSDAFPEFLGQLSFVASDQNDTVLALDVTIQYTMFKPI